MERLEREPYLFWNLTYESEGFQLSGKMVVDNWTSTKKSNNNIDPYLLTTMF